MPYQTIIIAAIVPAFMHFFGVFMQVHFEAKRVGLRGLTPEEMPDWRAVMRQDWPTLIPLAALIWTILVDGSHALPGGVLAASISASSSA